jgi:hypothetical protein
MLEQDLERFSVDATFAAARLYGFGDEAGGGAGACGYASAGCALGQPDMSGGGLPSALALAALARASMQRAATASASAAAAFIDTSSLPTGMDTVSSTHMDHSTAACAAAAPSPASACGRGPRCALQEGVDAAPPAPAEREVSGGQVRPAAVSVKSRQAGRAEDYRLGAPCRASAGTWASSGPGAAQAPRRVEPAGRGAGSAPPSRPRGGERSASAPGVARALALLPTH